MMNKKRMCLVFLFLLLTLCGCQLAVEKTETVQSEDLLIGVYITRDPLELSQGPIYAEEIDGRYHFDIEGIPFFSPISYSENGAPNYTIYCKGLMVDNVHYKTSGTETDKLHSVLMEGTLYVTPKVASNTYYPNEVYQTTNGEVYMTYGAGMGAGHDDRSEYRLWSIAQDASVTISEANKNTTRSVDFTLNFAVMFPPRQIDVLQMDEKSQIIQRDTFTPGQLPDSYQLAEGTAYLIVETHKTSPNYETVVARTFIDHGEKSMHTYYAREDDVCVTQSTELLWSAESE